MDNRTRQDARPERALTGSDKRPIAIHRKDRIMKFVCPVCGYVEEFDGDQLPEDFKCPQCGGKIILKKSRNNRKFYGCASVQSRTAE